jgi:hypothetical protein
MLQYFNPAVGVREPTLDVFNVGAIHLAAIQTATITNTIRMNAMAIHRFLC